ncbi:uncharacterized protein PFL1_00887 [Pseudozyma flocculosa PF-1]|uniref:Uncharacterized protein n=1 Tax=Pseudozyma flocculosa TaxID=84751 RepID=A0A5C3F3V6_9BASI|nr:uncharacterized protein PFL1_00887 [Pseudozyma flocculosa PF-1]EPQ31554.1 hypothetical protein PFL1_00887 [Pseudozyma flocculosa PF-1]SPO38655.1 uncharacterized protein PSFLO_04134 [Pseudozyma flocculosa]
MKFLSPLLVSGLLASSAVSVLAQSPGTKVVKNIHFDNYGTFSIQRDGLKHLFMFDADDGTVAHSWTLAERKGTSWQYVIGVMSTGFGAYANNDVHRLGVWDELNSPHLDLTRYEIVYMNYGKDTPLPINRPLQVPHN